LKGSAKVTADELREYCKERMARFKVPKEVEFLPILPKGPTGKLLKRTLRDMSIRDESGRKSV
jgi:acyl-CoA synthetase (AMP-forming)/AMP-acid ligase II